MRRREAANKNKSDRVLSYIVSKVKLIYFLSCDSNTSTSRYLV